MRAVRLVVWGLVIALSAGCASSKVADYRPYEGTIPRPGRILVYDFVSAPADLPPEVAVAGDGLVASPQTPGQLALGRTLGAEVASDLVGDLQQAGLPAVRAAGAPGPQVGDALVVGYFASVDPGNATERVVVGFGYGGAEMKTVVKGYLMTADGLRPLGSGAVEAGSGKTPGGAVPLAVTLATANPLGLIVSGAAKAYGEYSGSETIAGAARRTADEIAARIKQTAQRQGWLP